MADIFKRKSRKLKFAKQNTTAAWRRYQRSYRKKTAKRRTLARLPGYLLILCMAVLLVKGGFYILEWRLSDSGEGAQNADVQPAIKRLDHSELRKLLDPADFINPENNVIRKKIANREYTFQTTLDPQLQRAVVSMLDPRWARHIAIVVMEPETGRILAMASHNSKDTPANPCISADFPAASLFKIVSAAAAIETCGFKPEKEISFNGGKYTLYKSQLKETENRYTNHITLESAFAQSVNPVFGKIGRDYLGKTMLEKYAADFGFNREIVFDLPLETSIAPVSDKSYNWAEVACGFNKDTRISPLHGAMLAGSVINNGIMVEPRLIDTVALDERTVYRQKKELLARPVSPKTARLIKPLMHASITRGTARASFRGTRGSAIHENFEIGGKTGSINYNPELLRYDWFVGYARHKETGKKIAVSVLVTHEEYIGTRSSEYFRKIIEEYSQNYIQTAGIQK